MGEIPISKFKANCAAIIAGVAKTKRRVVITRHGKPVAEIVPPSRPRGKRSWLGCMAGTAEIVGDVVSSPWTPEELEEMEAEWLKSWNEQEAKARRIEARNRRSKRKMSGAGQ
jgi:prevent-host-death family protein